MMASRRKLIGVGVGLRHEHLADIVAQQPDVPWFEVLVDNWMVQGGLDRSALHGIAEQYPLAFHGVNLNLGGVDPLDWDYLKAIRELMRDCQVVHYSEHACFSRYQQDRFFDLCPLPFTEEMAVHLADRIASVQDFLGQRILLENVSRYLNYQDSYLSEAEFLAMVAKRADCLLLLDINNLYVNSVNHGDSVDAFLQTLAADSVAEIHLAGYEEKDGFLLDTHSRAVCDNVWQWYEAALACFGPVPTLIEWDHDLPAWKILQAERLKAEARWR